MDTIGDSKYVWVRFGKDGAAQPDAAGMLSDAMKKSKAEHLVVISHGWKNSEDDAAALYRNLWTSTAASLKTESANVLVVGVQWPARRYEPAVDTSILRSASKGGNLLSTGGAGGKSDLDDGRFRLLVELFLETLDGGEAAKLREAIRNYVSSKDATAADNLYTLAASAVRLSDAPDGELMNDRSGLLKVGKDPANGLKSLAKPPVVGARPGTGTTQGLGDKISSFLDGPRAAVIRLLEQFSYFEMKKRAGAVGRNLGAVLGEVDGGGRPLHLVGHSFGGRVVTAAAAGFQPGAGLNMFSLTLLQAAFSHNGMSSGRKGAFDIVPSKVEGPISITHTFNDNACTEVYALASRLSGDNTRRIGDKTDDFGSMGANGAQFDVGETLPIEISLAKFKPKKGRVTNYLADTYISGHSDVCNNTVGKLVASAIEA